MREFTGANNSGKVFSIDIIDWTGDEITCSFFNQAADYWYNRLEKG